MPHGQTRAVMRSPKGTALDVDNNDYDIVLALQRILDGLVQIVTNTGGTDSVNMESILQSIEVINTAIQAATEATAASTASADARLEGVRNYTEATAIWSETSAASLAAIEVINTAIQVAVEILDNYVGTHDAAAPASLAIIGGVAETGVPAAVADGDAVRINYDEYGRHRDAAHDPALSAGQVSDVAPAQMQVLTETGWAALSAAGDETPVVDVRDYENHTIVYDITIGSLTSMDLIIWGSIDNALWFPMSAFNVLSTDTLEDAVTFSGVQVTYIKCELEAENGDTDGSVVFQISSGN